jgi:hypothetical protein
MSKSDQALIYRRAEELAQTGDYAGWAHIELALVEEGHPQAPVHLASRAKRHWLDMLWARHGKQNPP